MYRLDDLEYMAEALRLARQGTALASPNPRVGAVLVRDGQVVGRGYHRYAEIAHAETLALAEAGERAGGATLFINLEPCCHHGRTPPCTDALLAAGVARVVAAMADPNPQVAGAGLRRLEAAGVRTELGCMEREARRLNRDFDKWIRTSLPWVRLKAAISLDGRIAPAPRTPGVPREWISSTASRARVQQMRHEHDAILTGVGTVVADDPLLTDRTRLPRRRPLCRVVLDSRLRTPPTARLLKGARRDRDLLIFCTDADPARRAALEKAGARIEVLPAGPAGPGRVDLHAMLAALGAMQLISVLLEGGSRLNGAMLAAECVDDVVLFQAPLLLGDGALPLAAGLFGLPHPRLGPLSAEIVGGDVMLEAELNPLRGSLEMPPAERASPAGNRSHDSERPQGATRVRSGGSTPEDPPCSPA